MESRNIFCFNLNERACNISQFILNLVVNKILLLLSPVGEQTKRFIKKLIHLLLQSSSPNQILVCMQIKYSKRGKVVS